MSEQPEVARPATMVEIARRPRWVLTLLVALGIAAAFAALGQWQLSRSFEGAELVDTSSEQVLPLEQVAQPDGTMTTVAIGQLVEVEADFVDGDSVILVDRLVESDRAAWVVAHAVTRGGGSIAVALGWAPDEDAAAA